MSQNELCGTSISRTTLSKFENNKLSPSYDVMSFLLQQINMTDEEFNFICNDYQYDERSDIINLFFGSTSNLDSKVLSSLQKTGETYLQNNDDIFIKNILKITESLQILSKDPSTKINCLPKIIVSDVWREISKRDEWYYSDLRIINCLMYYFPIETVISFLPKLLKYIDCYKNFTPVITIKISIILNVAFLLIQNAHKELALPILEEAIKLGKSAKRYDYLGIAEVRYGICTSDYYHVQKGLDILAICEEHEIKQHLEEEASSFYRK